MKISIIIPVYNAESYVEEAVLSALKQPETGEVILIEDGSQDNSLEVCKSLDEKFEEVKLFTHGNNENRGEAASRNLGIKKAIYNYICFLDADDYYLDNRFKITKDIFQSNKKIDCVYEAIEARFEKKYLEENWIKNNIPKLTSLFKKNPTYLLFDYLYFGTKGRFAVGGVTLKKDFINKCGLFDEDLRISTDTNMWLKMSLVGNLAPGSIEKAISVRRIHDNNTLSFETDLDMIKHRIKVWQSLLEWSYTKKISLTKKAQIHFRVFYFEKMFQKKKTKTSPLNTIKTLFLYLMNNPLRGFLVFNKYIWFYLIKR